MTASKRILSILGLAVAAAAGSVQAADMPQRKSGLWEIKTSADGTPGMTVQMCVDQRQDDVSAQRDSNQGIRKQCSKIDTKRSGNTVVIDSVCKFDQTTATGHTVITGNLSSQYRMESTTQFSPPVHGMASNHAVMEGRWLGPCKPGQKHGSMTVTGMPGGGKFDIDPEMMKQMQKMQQQYGR
ncbi:DUF3617 family protein [Parasulfuritortus cantonensis]|uniref:DUF3617 family protein n=1 Tax=Parasulfuritortus cantonensis TaxID=2528202 RepID=A0A4V2NV15_9PROT|nr:DUF3617 family protein [Parasulfuritortus cantonensis]TCJ11766.1 DUF3617 family protein [Parasulfuritortus cantonensis]